MTPIETVRPRRRRSCLLIGCLVAIGLFTLTGTVGWALLVASSRGESHPRNQAFEHALPPGPGTIELGVRLADVEIVPGPPGSPLRLEAAWDEDSYRLEQWFRPNPGGWRYDLHFHG